MKIFNCWDSKPEETIKALKYWLTRKENSKIHRGEKERKDRTEHQKTGRAVTSTKQSSKKAGMESKTQVLKKHLYNRQVPKLLCFSQELMKFMSRIFREMNMRPWILNLRNTDHSQLKVKSKGAYFLVSTLK